MARKVYISSDMSIDERLMELGTAALLWPWFLLAFDDWGRADASPRRLKAQVFPMMDTVDVAHIEEALHQFAAAGLIQLYEVEGRRYMAIAPDKWFQYQTHIRSEKRDRDASRYPAPPRESALPSAPERETAAEEDTPARESASPREPARHPAQMRANARNSAQCCASPSPSPSLSPSPSPSPSLPAPEARNGAPPGPKPRGKPPDDDDDDDFLRKSLIAEGCRPDEAAWAIQRFGELQREKPFAVSDKLAYLGRMVANARQSSRDSPLGVQGPPADKPPKPSKPERPPPGPTPEQQRIIEQRAKELGYEHHLPVASEPAQPGGRGAGGTPPGGT